MDKLTYAAVSLVGTVAIYVLGALAPVAQGEAGIQWLNLVANGGSLVLLAVLLVYIVPKIVKDQREGREREAVQSMTERKEMAAERTDLTKAFREELQTERQHCATIAQADRAAMEAKFDRLYGVLTEQGKAITEKTQILRQQTDMLKEQSLALKADMLSTDVNSKGILAILQKIEAQTARPGGKRQGDPPTA